MNGILPIKTCLAILILLVSPVCAAVFSLPRPADVLWGFPPVSRDLNGDGSDDITVRFYETICYTNWVSGNYCTFGATISFGSDVELYGTIADGELIPAALSAETVLGASVPAGSWSATNGFQIKLIYKFGSAEGLELIYGYPPYAQSMDRIFIGFRVPDPEGYKYGWLDVQLSSTAPRDPADPIKLFPDINGIYLADSHDTPVTVAPIPEPSVTALILGGLSAGGFRRHRRSARASL